MRATTRNLTRRAGFSLIEVMVAVFVLTVGLLGSATLQVASKRSTMEGMQRATAVMLAQSIAERIRTNDGELSTYTDAGVGRTLTGSTMSAVDCTSSCTASQLALYDLYEWEQQLAGVTEKSGTTNVGGLVSPTACIAGPAGGAGTYTVTIAWRGVTSLSDPTVSACGQGSGLYDSNDGTETDVYRRVLVIQTYVAPV